MPINRMPGAIVEMQGRLAEAGRIRLGAKFPTQNGKERPGRLAAFRLTSRNLDALSILAGLYGGAPQPWVGAPRPDEFELYTDSDLLDVIVPPEHMSVSQSNELWSGGGCARRCDGIRLDTGGQCVCARLEEDGIPDSRDNPRCRPTTRLSVMLRGIPTSGLWRVETKGYYAATEIEGAFRMAEFVTQASGRQVLAGHLRLDYRETKRPGQADRQFVVPVLEWDIDATEILGGGRSEIAAPAPIAALPSGLTPVPEDDADEPVASLADQIQGVGGLPRPAPRKNAATPLPATGRRPAGRGAGSDPTEAVASEPTAAAPAKKASTPRKAAGARKAAPREEDAGNAGPEPITQEQKNKLFAIVGDIEWMDTREKRLQYLTDTVARPIISANELSKAEAMKVIDELEILIGNAPPPGGFEPFPDPDDNPVYDAQDGVEPIDPGPIDL